jgi:predicted Rossmann fold flavoprotein
MSQIYDLAVVGGGAAGLMAAIAAAQETEKSHRKIRIVVLEANSRVGKKLLATGNGRCNLTNMGVSKEHYHGDVKYLSPVLEKYSPGNIISYFESLGLLCREQDEGRVYPYNLQASSVLDVLRYQLDRFGIETKCDFTVTEVHKNKACFSIVSSQGSISAERVIFATGGMAYPQLGANGTGYKVIESFGHRIAKPYPALVQLKTDPKRAKPLKGARSQADAALLIDGKRVKTVNGEVQFTENGLSGICIFELSRMVGEQLPSQKVEVSLDLMPDYSTQQILSILKNRKQILRTLPTAELLNGMVNKLVGTEIVRQTLPHSAKLARELQIEELTAAANAVKNFIFPITGTLSWKDAQVTAGGVPLSELDGSLQSKFCPGLYLAGELCNIDGDCGGYNLHWAWSSGIISGRAAAQSLMEQR